MKETVKTLRHNTTPTEQLMWFELRSRKLAGLKFRRQYPIPPYIVDFYCSEHKLILEIDGSVHFSSEEVIAYDQQRQVFLEASGYRILRFTTQDVENRLPLVLETITNVTR